MADNKNFISDVEALFRGMERVISTKTVVGEAMKVEDAIIIPLVDVSFGMGVGSSSRDKREGNSGGMGTKMSPAAILVIQNGVTKLVNVRNQDVVNKALDMVPDLINRFTRKQGISSEAMGVAKDMATEMAKTKETVVVKETVTANDIAKDTIEKK